MGQRPRASINKAENSSLLSLIDLRGNYAFPLMNPDPCFSVRSDVGLVNVIPISCFKGLGLHHFQGDLLGQKDITHRQVALRRKAPVRHYIARSIQFVNVHHLAAPDAISGSGVRTQDIKLTHSVPPLRLFRTQPGT